jgi:hypothetical protein
MKKSTLVMLIATAVLLCVGWLTFDSFGMVFIILAALSAAVSLYFALRRK